MMKKGIILLLVILFSLSIGFWIRGCSEEKAASSSLNTDSLESVIMKRDSAVRALTIKLDSLRSIKDEKIKDVEKMKPESGVKYLEERLNEKKDSVSPIIFYEDSTKKVTIDSTALSLINGSLEENRIMKSEIGILDSLVIGKDSIIIDKNKIIGIKTEQIENLQKQIKKGKKKLTFYKITTGLGVLTAIIFAAL